MIRLLCPLVLSAVFALACALPARAAALDPDEVMARMQGAEPGLQTYRAQVEFRIRMLTFPLLRKTLHGEAFFKRPDRLELVFSDLPAIAQQFRQLYVGLGSPAEWRQKFVVGATDATLDGKAAVCLILTPKAAGRRLSEVDVYLDPQSALPLGMVWHYRDGTIQMRQEFVEVDGYSVIGAQTTDIAFRFFHAVIATRISGHAINATFDESVFTPKKT